MLGVTLPAAALLLPAVLGHHKVVAAVVAEDATTKPGNLKEERGGSVYIDSVIWLTKHFGHLAF